MTDPTDEIVFGEMRLREPARMRRPDHDPARACLSYGTPHPDDLPIFLDRKSADEIERHALSDTSVELGGVLLGKECVDDETGAPFVLVSEALQAHHYQNTQASFTYTHESWEQISRERDENFPDLDVVGWYHTHPDFGIFLSSHDLFIHHHFFSQPLQVAYVVDPIRQTRGFFRWAGGEMVPVRGFHLAGDRRERAALARLVNDLEGLPPAESGGGSGLSPVLEAELLAMLSRPQYSAPPPAAGSSAAAGLIGAVLGMIAVGLALWLFQVHNTLREQAEQMNALAKSQSEASRSVVGAVEGARISAKEGVLDELLARIEPGEPPERVRARLAVSAGELRGLRDRIEGLETDKVALAALANQVRAEAETLELARAKAAKAAADSEARVEEAEAKRQEVEDALAVRESLLKEGETGALAARYNVAFWAAAGGWAAFVVAATGLVVTLTRPRDSDPGVDLGIPRQPFGIDPNPAGPGQAPPSSDQPAPHRIQ